jgi:hypothetical protein
LFDIWTLSILNPSIDISKKKWSDESGMVILACSLNTKEAEARGMLA